MITVGQTVRIKSLEKIQKLLDRGSRDKKADLFFNEEEMAQFCGKTFKVKERRMRPSNPVPRYILEGATSLGRDWLWAETWLELPDKRPRRRLDNV